LLAAFGPVFQGFEHPCGLPSSVCLAGFACECNNNNTTAQQKNSPNMVRPKRTNDLQLYPEKKK
jgi:hypothetical protein